MRTAGRGGGDFNKDRLIMFDTEDDPRVAEAIGGAAVTADELSFFADAGSPEPVTPIAAETAAGSCAVGTVLHLSGTAWVTRNGIKLALNAGDRIQEKDVIDVGPGSTVDLAFVDGSVFNLSADTELRVGRFAHNSAGVAQIDLVHGAFSFVAGSLIKTRDMEIHTPVANLLVHGIAIPAEVIATDGLAKFSLLGAAGDEATGAGSTPPMDGGGYSLSGLDGDPLGVLDRTGSFMIVKRTEAGSFETSYETKTASELLSEQSTGQVLLQSPPLVQLDCYASGSDGGGGGGGGGGSSTPAALLGFLSSPELFLASQPLLATAIPSTGTGAPNGGADLGSPGIASPGSGPAPGAGGSDDTLHIEVGNGDSATATLSETDAGLETRGTLTVTDSGGSNQITASVSSVIVSGTTGGLTAADIIGMLSVTPPSFATSPGAAQSLGWTYNSGAESFAFLAPGQALVQTYTITVDDGQGDRTLQTITITIAGTNDAAVISGDTTGAVLEAGGASNGTPGTPVATGDLNSTDVDNPSDSWNAVGSAITSDNGYGTYTLTAAGVWTYSLNNSNLTVQALNVGQTLTDTFTTTTMDGTAQVVTITDQWRQRRRDDQRRYHRHSGRGRRCGRRDAGDTRRDGRPQLNRRRQSERFLDCHHGASRERERVW